MPLVPDLFLEDLLWLFHPGGSPEGRCSLTPHKSLHSCPGFPALSETDYNNGTYLQQVLTLSSLGANHTGDYMCQVKTVCEEKVYMLKTVCGICVCAKVDFYKKRRGGEFK